MLVRILKTPLYMQLFIFEWEIRYYTVSTQFGEFDSFLFSNLQILSVASFGDSCFIMFFCTSCLFATPCLFGQKLYPCRFTVAMMGWLKKWWKPCFFTWKCRKSQAFKTYSYPLNHLPYFGPPSVDNLVPSASFHWERKAKKRFWGWV